MLDSDQPSSFFGSAIFGYKLFNSSCSSDHSSSFHPFTAGSYSGLVTGFRWFVTSDFGGFAKSIDILWLNDTLFGGKLGFEHFDVESAYCHVLVHSDDCYLLGMKWQVKYFINLALPFGLRSAPYIFSSFADLIVWILKHNYGINFLLHYLDNFHTLGSPNSPVCQNNVNTCVRLFSEWGIPLHPDKLEGPSTCLMVLCIELDSRMLQARPPQDKFDHIAALLESWSLKQHCTWKEVESLISHLQHACKVIPQGRTFLRRMINLLSAFLTGWPSN